uniref:Uncharacterized protein n=1 Tax=Steinernema glaseri TaxID=37863 RepID=A0A1I7YHK5_9BILA
MPSLPRTELSVILSVHVRSADVNGCVRPRRTGDDGASSLTCPSRREKEGVQLRVYTDCSSSSPIVFHVFAHHSNGTIASLSILGRAASTRSERPNMISRQYGILFAHRDYEELRPIVLPCLRPVALVPFVTLARLYRFYDEGTDHDDQ